MGKTTAAEQAQVCVVHRSGRLERSTWLFPSQHSASKTTQLVASNWYEWLVDVGIALLNLIKNPRHYCHGG
jgi:hypothetical protein